MPAHPGTTDNPDATYGDPMFYVPRYLKIGEDRVEVSGYTADRLMEEDLYIIWGLPGSGKTTIAREVARRLHAQGYPSLHIIFRYNNKLLLPRTDRRGYPPALLIDVTAMSYEKIKKLSEIIIELAKKYHGPGESRDYTRRMAASLESIIGEGGGSRCERIIPWVRTVATVAYLLGVTNIDIIDFIDCKNVKDLPGRILDALRSLPARRRGWTRRGLLVIFDNIDSQDRVKIDVAQRLIAEVKEGLAGQRDVALKQLYVYTMTESEYAWLRVTNPVTDHIESFNEYIAEKLGLPAAEVAGRVLPSMIPYPPPEEILAIARANGLEVGRDELGRIREIAACSGWHISLILNMLRVEHLKNRSIGGCPPNRSHRR